MGLKDFNEARINTVCAAIQSVVPKLKSLGVFSLENALQLAGWPTEIAITVHFQQQVISLATQQGLLIQDKSNLTLGSNAERVYLDSKARFEHLRNRFLKSLSLRIRRNYPQLKIQQADAIANDIEASLVGFFRQAGLSLATTLLSSSHQGKFHGPVPSSIIKFLNEAAAQYQDSLSRQAFSTISIDIFSQPEDPDKEYLGRVSQGFFAFHALGLFDESVNERLIKAQKTVWLIDSSAQIPALALAAPTNALFRDIISKLIGLGIRLFTTESLFNETNDHYWFADNVIKENGSTSPLVIAAALGHPPYRKANQFLEGFIRWQAAGNPPDWNAYIAKAIGHANPTRGDLRKALTEDIGIEVVDLTSWPGYESEDLIESTHIASNIVNIWEKILCSDISEDPDFFADYFKKAEPEAEALLIVLREREGRYHILSPSGECSPAWFVSQTSMLNLVHSGSRITWQPEAFLRFASTLAPSTDSQTALKAFDMLLLAFTEAGVSLLDEKSLLGAFGGVIDQAALSLEPLHEAYEQNLKWKYSESPQDVVNRVPPAYRPLAAIQLANEIALVQADKSKYAEAIAASAIQRAIKAETKLESLQGVERKINKKRQDRERQARKRKSKQSIKKHRKK